MIDIVDNAKKKVFTMIFLAFIIIIATGILSFYTVRGGFSIYSFYDIDKKITNTRHMINDFSKEIEDVKYIGNIISNVKYSNMQTLREVLLKELETMGLFVADVVLKERATVDGKRGTVVVPSTSRGVPSSRGIKDRAPSKEKATSVLNKGTIIESSVSGSILFKSIPDFLKKISSHDKIWGIEVLELVPKVSPSELISQFISLHKSGDKRGVEMFFNQGQAFLQDETSFPVSVKLKFIVVVE